MTTTKTDPLLDVVDRLTIEHLVTAPIEGGKNHYERHDALIKQLRDAIASNLGGSAGGKPPQERIPLDADALMKYEQLEIAIGALFQNVVADTIPGLYPEDNLRQWFLAFTNLRRAGLLTDTIYDGHVRTLEGWATTIEEKLSAPTVRELFDETGQPEVCPECGAGWYEVILNAGVESRNPDGSVKRRWYEKERRVALTASYHPDDRGGLSRSFVRCGCCNTVWMDGQGIRALAYELEHRGDGTVSA